MITDPIITPDGVLKLARRAALASHHNKWGFRGVSWDNSHNRFRAEIGNNTTIKRKRLGRFRTVQEAASAYDIAALEMYGDDAALNFPMPEERQTKFGRNCPHGEANIYISPDNQRLCRVCNKAAAARY